MYSDPSRQVGPPLHAGFNHADKSTSYFRQPALRRNGSPPPTEDVHLQVVDDSL